jgi:hypothetical protein
MAAMFLRAILAAPQMPMRSGVHWFSAGGIIDNNDLSSWPLFWVLDSSVGLFSFLVA